MPPAPLPYLRRRWWFLLLVAGLVVLNVWVWRSAMAPRPRQSTAAFRPRLEWQHDQHGSPGKHGPTAPRPNYASSVPQSWVAANGITLGILMGLLTLVASVVALAFTARHYVSVRRAEQRQQRFVNYHKLIRQLVAPDADGASPMLDSQIAVAFELRNYREYRELTGRLLSALYTQWSAKRESERLLSEITLTLKHLKELRP